MTGHTLLSAFKANKAAFGVWLFGPGYFHARNVARSSPHLSWVLIDCENGLVTLDIGLSKSIAGVTTGSRSTENLSSIVRIPATGDSDSMSWQIKYALDAGAHGVLVPLVSTAEQAQEVVTYSRYPPTGRRGLGSPYSHGTWGLGMAEYADVANDHVLAMVQIETKEGVDNIEKIAALDGIDVLFIGPYDLSVSLGYPPPVPDIHPDVEKVIQRILQVTHAAGKKCGIFCLTGSQGAKRVAEGFDMINVTTDTGSLTEAMSGHLAAAAGGSGQ
ncbi:hypothetical protein AX15_006686 [Amanita polypyramis BW_CC]|nr:hypothetical protein AX15_006686 [Amanita polypyramis BW_CC]